MGVSETYAEVMALYKQLSILDSVSTVLHWDQRVLMPPKGIETRAEAVAAIDRMLHERVTDPVFVEKVGLAAEGAKELDEDGQVNIRWIKRDVDRATKVPADLVERISKHTSHAAAAWEKAREESDFAAFAPFLKTMVELRIEEAHAFGFADNPYDAMLDRFEPFSDEKSTSALLEDLRARLVPFVSRVMDKPKKSTDLVIGPRFDVEKQRQFGLKVIGDLGFDFAGGRQDVSVHPFCAGSLGDVRITTRFAETDLRQALFGMMHEAGHALYEQGVNPDTFYSPLSEYCSMAVHESQSRLWENMVGRGRAFWNRYYGDLQATFPEVLGQASLNEYYQAINVIEGSLIRVEADEATYQLHIILRFEVESDLIAGRIEVDDLPEIWNEKMEKYLGVRVPNDAEGVLQDVHWSEGLFGYFPTYTIGNLYSAQLYAKAAVDLGDLDAQIEAGDFATLLGWLRENVHRHGKRYPAAELIERVTGAPPSAEPFMDYLEKKFGPLYEL
jgi:carboxypeptidase Taq